MAKRIRRLAWGGVLVVLVVAAASVGYLNSKKAVRSGSLTLPGLSGKVEVRFDTYAIPHIYADNETDAYYALGYVHAQERLFHMELLRRLAKGELAEILGPKLKTTDAFFRTLRLRQFGLEYLAQADRSGPGLKASQAYLNGVNRFIRTGPSPVEFDLLGIKKSDFLLSDMISVAGYMAYSFATGFKSDPVLTFIRDELGGEYLTDMDYGLSQARTALAKTHESLAQMAGLVADIDSKFSPLGAFEGSNAWAVSGTRTRSGKPILSGDPHIAHSCPSVWYEAHLVTPGWDFYGHFLSGLAMPLLGFNQHTAWTLTMFQNDDVDLFAEKTNPDNSNQVWSKGQWVDLVTEREIIKVKGEPDLELTIRISPHGPIINDILDTLNREKRPVAVSWGFHDRGNDMLNGLYELTHLKTISTAPAALEKIHAPGLNFVMADDTGNIGWWAVARLPKRPGHVDPNFILDGSDPAHDYQGAWPFEANPWQMNPASGVIVSANNAPQGFEAVPGYYNHDNRVNRIRTLLAQREGNWTPEEMKALPLDTESLFYKGIRNQEAAILRGMPEIHEDAFSRKAFESFEAWDGFHDPNSRGAAIFYAFHYYLAENLFRDELGEDRFKAFLATRLADNGIRKLLGIKDSPWWDNAATPQKETQGEIMALAWGQALDALASLGGQDPDAWVWENFHPLEFVHALGRKKPLNLVFNIGPFKSGGAREVLNYQGFRIAPPPFDVYIGPSTRRIIDFSDPDHSLGINPSGQSGYFWDPHFDDQTRMYLAGHYRTHLTDRGEIQGATASVLTLAP